MAENHVVDKKMNLHKIIDQGLLIEFQNDHNGFRTEKALKLNKDAVKLIENDSLDKYRKLKRCIQHHFFSKTIYITGNEKYVFPIHLQIELTDFCNLKCKYCYREAINIENDAHFVNWNQLKLILEKLKKYGLLYVTLTGGEPTLHPEFSQIMEFCINEFEYIELITNGYQLQKIIDVFNKIPTNLAKRVNISLSFNEWVENFNKYIAQIQVFGNRLLQLIKIHPIRINAVDFKYDNRKAKTLKKKFRNIGIKHVDFDIAMPIGRANNFTNTKNYLNIKNYNHKYLNSNEKESKPRRENDKHNCELILRHLTIDPLGNIRLCALFPLTKVIGNIFEQGFDFFQDPNISKMFSYSAPSKNICGKCENLSYCDGCVNHGMIEKNMINSCVFENQLVKHFK